MVHLRGVSRVIPGKYHRKFDTKLIAKDNITEDLLRRTYINKPTHLSGRTIVNYAKEATREAKKMLSLVDEAVKARILEKNGGEYSYPSGKNVNYFPFCVYIPTF